MYHSLQGHTLSELRQDKPIFGMLSFKREIPRFSKLVSSKTCRQLADYLKNHTHPKSIEYDQLSHCPLSSTCFDFIQALSCWEAPVQKRYSTRENCF